MIDGNLSSQRMTTPSSVAIESGGHYTSAQPTKRRSVTDLA
jgi:hypothetical protein